VTNFAELLTNLAKANVAFVVVGGYATILLGAGVVTQDLDVCYERTPENLQRLVSAIQPYHPRLRGAPPNIPFLWDVRTLSQGMNFTLETDLGDLDLLGYIDGVGGYSNVVVGAAPTPLFDVEYLVASVDVLIRSKRAAGRSKDLQALPELEAIKEMLEKKSKK
jgi:hypothetical protein